MIKIARNHKDNIAKVVALITAIVLWFIVMNEQNPPADMTYHVPLHVRNVQADHFVSHDNDTVDVVVRGPRSIVASVPEDEFYAYLDMADLSEGHHKVKVHVVVPQGVELVSVSPDKCDITLDKMVRETRKVEAVCSGLATEGVKVDEVKTEVESVKLDGPSLLVSRVAKVIAHIELDKQDKDFSEEADITAVDSDGNVIGGVTITPNKTAIKGKVISVPIEKTVDVNFRMIGELPTEFALKGIRADADTVVISGYRPNVEAVSSLNTEPLNLSNIMGSTTVALRILFPEGISAEKQTITVTIDVVKKAR